MPDFSPALLGGILRGAPAAVDEIAEGVVERLVDGCLLCEEGEECLVVEARHSGCRLDLSQDRLRQLAILHNLVCDELHLPHIDLGVLPRQADPVAALQLGTDAHRPTVIDYHGLGLRVDLEASDAEPDWVAESLHTVKECDLEPVLGLQVVDDGVVAAHDLQQAEVAVWSSQIFFSRKTEFSASSSS